MQALQDAIAQAANPWPVRRERAEELARRYPHAAEMLRLYQTLLPIQADAYQNFPPPLHPARRLAGTPELGEGRVGAPDLDTIASFAVERVMPSIIDATVSAGPPTLRDGVVGVFCTADLAGIVHRWLDSESLDPFETYLARASASPLLEALNSRRLSPSPPRSQARVDPGSGGGQGAGSCPTCGGLPQLSYFAVSGEALVTGPRYLVCSRCSTNWIFSRMTCAGCGENDGGKLPIFQDSEQLSHVRIDGCRTCHRYLLTFDLRRDQRAVPVVDELAALPLDLFAKTQGLTKITPNLMGN